MRALSSRFVSGIFPFASLFLSFSAFSGCVPYLPSLGDQQEKLEGAHATHPRVAATASPFLGSQQPPNQLCTPD